MEDPIDYLKSHSVSESQFRSNVQQAYNSREIVETTGEDSPVVHTKNIVYIFGNNVNVRKGPDSSDSVLHQLN